MSGVYLICFSASFGHAKHYLGYADDIDSRISRHRANKGAKLLKHVNNAQIGWSVVRTWPSMGREFERRMKCNGHVKLACPLCNPTGYQKYYSK